MSFIIKQFLKVDICEKNWINDSWVGCESFSSFVKLNEMDEDLKEVAEFENVLNKIKLLNYEIVKNKLLLAHFHQFLMSIIGFFCAKIVLTLSLLS